MMTSGGVGVSTSPVTGMKNTRPAMKTKPSNMHREEFLAVFGQVFEHSPWVAENAWSAELEQHHDSASGLHQLMGKVVSEAEHEKKLNLLNAHPQLACAISSEGITETSISEQQRSGLDQCSAEEFSEFQSLNKAYREKYGFPFILAIKGYQRAEILAVFRRRLHKQKDEEFSSALEQVMKIGMYRLQDIFQ